MKSCPFCGSAELKISKPMGCTRKWVVGCPECECWGPPGPTLVIAVNNWDARSPNMHAGEDVWVKNLGLSSQGKNRLRDAGILKLSDLATRRADEVFGLKGLSGNCRCVLRDAMNLYGVRFLDDDRRRTTVPAQESDPK